MRRTDGAAGGAARRSRLVDGRRGLRRGPRPRLMSTTSPRLRGASTSSSGGAARLAGSAPAGLSAVCAAGLGLRGLVAFLLGLGGVRRLGRRLPSAASAGFASACGRGGLRGRRAARRRTVRIVWPTLTFSPGLTLTSLTTPATDDGTSIVALSVSSSRPPGPSQSCRRLDEHAHDVAGGDVLAEFGKLEFSRAVQCSSRV